MQALPNDSAGFFPPTRVLLVLLTALTSVACGSSTPTQPPGPKAGGTVTGNYTLELIPAATCNLRSVSFPVQVTATATFPHPGVQLLLVGSDPAVLELELEYVDNTLAGGVGSIGVLLSGGAEFYVNAIASGATTQTSDGRGEVLSGTLRGYMEIDESDGVTTNSCNSPNHSFTLRAQ